MNINKKSFLFLITIIPWPPPNMPETKEDLYTVLWRIADWAFTIALIIAVIAFVLAGLQYMISGGDEKKIIKARLNIIYASIGVVIFLLSKLLVMENGILWNLLNLGK